MRPFSGQLSAKGGFSRLHPGAGRHKVREINEFGFDFLRLCDGQSTLEEIADQLYPKYGANKDREQFAVICAEAAGTLAGLEAPRPVRIRLILRGKEVKGMLQVKEIEKKILATTVNEASTTYVVPT